MSYPDLRRRSFLTHGAAALGSLALPWQYVSSQKRADQGVLTRAQLLESRDPAKWEVLAGKGVEAACHAGAGYAEVRCRDIANEWFYAFTSISHINPGPQLRYSMGVSVRVMVGGQWGFVVINGVPSESVILDAVLEAVNLAKIAKGTGESPLSLAPVAPVKQGRWTTPIRIDPFHVTTEERVDFGETFLRNMSDRRYRMVGGMSFDFIKDTTTLATSDGVVLTQTQYVTGGELWIALERWWQNEVDGGWRTNLLSPAGAGWEHICDAPIHDEVGRMIEMGLLSQRKRKFLDIGRYDIVFDAHSTADLLDLTIGRATELDRCLGFHANSIGTSFLDSPLEMLGEYKLGTPSITITANRTVPKEAATVGWDAEGVAPKDTTLVKDGVLHDFQTSRESAMDIAAYYEKIGQPIQSNGCAGVQTVSSPVAQCPPNIALAAGNEATTMEDMIRSVKRGIAVFRGRGDIDHQCLNGGGRGLSFEIVDGKLGERVDNSLYLYRTPELWQQVTALGGPDSVEHIGMTRTRRRIGHGNSAYTVSVPPILVSNMRVSDVSRAV